MRRPVHDWFLSWWVPSALVGAGNMQGDLSGLMRYVGHLACRTAACCRFNLIDPSTSRKTATARPPAGRLANIVKATVCVPVFVSSDCPGVVEQRDSRRIGLWRSARERAVWLLDVNRAEAAGSVAAAAYATVVLRDRLVHSFIYTAGTQHDVCVKQDVCLRVVWEANLSCNALLEFDTGKPAA